MDECFLINNTFWCFEFPVNEQLANLFLYPLLDSIQLERMRFVFWNKMLNILIFFNFSLNELFFFFFFYFYGLSFFFLLFLLLISFIHTEHNVASYCDCCETYTDCRKLTLETLHNFERNNYLIHKQKLSRIKNLLII